MTNMVWQPLTPDDIEAVVRIANVIHSELPEGQHVFAERINLFPEGCLALVKQDGGGEGGSRELCGYAISHPIRRRQPPALDAVLGRIPPDASQYYIHDFCILPEFRGRGLAGQGIRKLLSAADDTQRFPDGACLVSVYGTVPFWARYGFVAPEPAIDAALAEKVRGYGEDARYLERPTALSS
ncbi:hypothetical protein PG993_004248 [Apiospora rasikravindrae]|uniref:N-acetyltransferase domain-containing protein n=1 Tax=Apiospora rasikravindrae TaxID=990691 RepID=A0ABR1TEM1_9PEZI